MDIEKYSPSLLSVSKLNDFGHNTVITQTENRKLLLRLIHGKTETSRKELAGLSGLKQATVTVIINDFLEKNIVEESGLIDGGNGRRVRGLRMVNRFCVVAVRLNVSYFSVAMYDIYGNNLYCHKIFMDTLSDLVMCCDLLVKEIERCRQACFDSGTMLLGIGLGVEGPFVIKDQKYQYYDREKKSYFDFAEEISRKVNYPVYINRMSNYAAYYVWKKQWRKPLGTIVSFTVSYTVECGIIVNGEMFNGSQGMAGGIGEVVCGHTADGHPICYKDVVCVDKILENTRRLMPEYPDSVLCQDSDMLNIRDIIGAYIRKDPLAVRVYDDCAVYCGRAINFIINMLNPDMVFFGDEVPLVDEYFEKVYREAVKGIYPYFDDKEFREQSDSTGYRIKVPEADISLKLLKPDKIRSTMNDPSLLGAAEYVVEASIENGMILEDL